MTIGTNALGFLMIVPALIGVRSASADVTGMIPSA
jgi:hypothetical protein